MSYLKLIQTYHHSKIQCNNIGRCPHCCEYVFLSKTEKKRHFQVFHPKARVPKSSVSDKQSMSQRTKRNERVTASPSLVYLSAVSSSSPGQAGRDSSVKNTVELGTSIESDYDDGELCVVCGLGEEEDEDDEVWVECTKCFNWVHKSYMPPQYLFTVKDEDFFCPDCFLKKPRRS